LTILQVIRYPAIWHPIRSEEEPDERRNGVENRTTGPPSLRAVGAVGLGGAAVEHGP